MRILIVAGAFGGENREPWLLDDLAIAFADAGDDVDVLAYDTRLGRSPGINPYPDKRIRVFGVGPTTTRSGRLGKIVNYVAAGLGLHRQGFQLVRCRRYDLCVYTSIGIFSWGLPARLRRAGVVRHCVFVLWDFFPVHQLEIGRLTQRVLDAPLRALEALSMKPTDAIAVMSPANERYLRAYHRSVRVRTIIVPPWASDPTDGNATNVARRERFTVIFGGQLVAGRGVDVLLEAARRLQDDNIPIELLIVGDGPARAGLTAVANRVGLINTSFLGKLPRADYRTLLQSVHVGVAITVPGVSPPTFPSKIVEYCAAGLPVVVCLEAASDAGAIIESAGAGLAVPAGDVARLASAFATLYTEYRRGSLQSRSRRARELFQERLSVSKAVVTLRSVAIQQ